MRCVDCNGNGAVAQFIAGLEWVAGNFQSPAVASMSLGSNAVNEALDSALQAVIALGVTGVVAAGNYGSGALPGAVILNPGAQFPGRCGSRHLRSGASSGFMI